ncbi:MAG: hypothetical protein K8L97_16950 [Anaerolineae bacterium]|nr:hypothetical protein [Anaerolineae bacterium]
MSQMSMSAVETGIAVVCSGGAGSCRRVVGIVTPQRKHGKLPPTLYNFCTFGRQ